MARSPKPIDAQLLELLIAAQAAGERVPSLRELAAATGVHAVTVRRHLDALARQGHLQREPRRWRRISALPQGDSAHVDLQHPQLQAA